MFRLVEKVGVREGGGGLQIQIRRGPTSPRPPGITPASLECFPKRFLELVVLVFKF